MIYFIRHGESEYNAKQAEIHKKYGQDFMKTEQYQTAKFSKEFLDVNLNQTGIKQCYQCKENFKDIDVDLVIVSPLRRALKTCEIVFQNHKSIPKAKIIVDPAFRQILCSSNDIGSKIDQSKNQLKSFDFQLVKNLDYWYLTNIVEKQISDRLLSKLQAYEDKKNGAIDITIQFLKQWFVKRQKDPQNYDLMRKVLPSLSKQRQILLNYLKEYKSIAVVSHSENIKSYVGYKIKNCQIYPYSQERLQNLKID